VAVAVNSEFHAAEATRVINARTSKYRQRFSISCIRLGPPWFRLLSKFPNINENAGIDDPWIIAAKTAMLK
jgi:hypothetical protein